MARALVNKKELLFQKSSWLSVKLCVFICLIVTRLTGLLILNHSNFDMSLLLLVTSLLFYRKK